ncbi:MAG: acyl-[Blautia sp.]|nr:acyl-[acyl-carrier-protein] thioesterase [Blautia sp.]
MAYFFDSRVRFSEAGTDGKLTLPGILDYFQDCCTFQADSINQGSKSTMSRNRIWVLSSWQVIINRYPEQGEFIRTTTLPYKLVMCFGHRNFKMEGENGELLAVANSLWTNLNIETGTPARLREDDLKGYVLDEKLEMPYAKRKLAVPEDVSPDEPFVIQKHQLDINHHVNNVQYVRMAMDYLPEGCVVREMKAEYHKQAFQGDVFCPAVKIGGDMATVLLNNEEGELYTAVEFRF